MLTQNTNLDTPSATTQLLNEFHSTAPFYNLTLISTPSNRVQLSLSPVKDFHNQKNKVEIPTGNDFYLPSGFELAMVFEQLLKLSLPVYSEIYKSLQLFRLAPNILFDSVCQYSIDLGCEDEQVYLGLAQKSIRFLFESGSLAFRQNCNATTSPIISSSSQTEAQNNSSQEKSQEDLETLLPALPRPKKFSIKSRRRMLDAAGALEKSGIPVSNFYFFTGTLPGSSERACEAFARSSRNILNAFKQYLRRLGIYETFNCWEWQLRTRQDLTPALHLHLVLVCEDEELGQRLPDLLREKWFDLLDNIKTTTGVDLYEKAAKLGFDSRDRNSEEVKNYCCKTVRCEKSPAAYLSKYVGKDKRQYFNDLRKAQKLRGFKLFYPSSWWSISNSLRDLIKLKTKSWSLRLHLDSALKIWDELAEVIRMQTKLELPQFSPDIPEWRLYQNFYVFSESFDDINSILDASVAAYKLEHYHEPWYHSFVKLRLYDSRSFNEKAFEWIKQYPAREYQFYRSLPEAEQTMINSADMIQEYIIPLAGDYVSRILHNNNFDLN